MFWRSLNSIRTANTGGFPRLRHHPYCI